MYLKNLPLLIFNLTISIPRYLSSFVLSSVVPMLVQHGPIGRLLLLCYQSCFIRQSLSPTVLSLKLLSPDAISSVFQERLAKYEFWPSLHASDHTCSPACLKIKMCNFSWTPQPNPAGHIASPQRKVC